MAVPENHLVANLADHVGHDFGTSKPVVLDQPRIDHFAECTGDRQWIHVDVERARTEGPFGDTIAHGLLTLSLIPAVQYELGVYPPDASNLLNYGFDKVRYLAPVPVGSAIVTRVEIAGVEPKGPGRYLVRTKNTAYTTGATAKPVLVAEMLAMVTA
jgi:acyl dehydratase